ncbi:bacteriophage f237 ORF7 [Vibrio mediterranei AK1]|uniref:zonular occludens toxin domain-containing protein n=1 Tax=Vibrio mediterranei TaxID=689 RepID=UPI00015428C3|nr:zonular occludens toxin domain-containing protein [Vibrio mediterranei]EDL50933.1 bacteriophage f237 ORF7 [Vibrio mediterranei AK1]
MAVTIRTGANGSYKSAYVAYFIIFEALKAGRVVVTNLEGMEPLEIIAQRFDIEFPSTTKLIRIFSRDNDGVELWQHFFCWCPLGALVVIDECQDLFSPKVGFDMKKVKNRPLSDFLPMLPEGYEGFFHSRHIPVDMSSLNPAETDDRGVAEYDENGRIIYPLTFNEGFMRHRKYNWDIELLSPSWKQVDTGIKECAEQAFRHKNRDGMFPWTQRKPYIYKHSTDVATASIPKKKDGNLISQYVPLEAHLLYKSTGTGKTTTSGGKNMLWANPMFWGVALLTLLCMGYFVYGFASLFVDDTAENQIVEASKVESSNLASTEKDHSSVNDLPNGRDSHSASNDGNSTIVNVAPDFLGFDGLQSLYMTGYVVGIKTNRYTKRKEILSTVSLLAKTLTGDFVLNDNYLRARNIRYTVLSECLLELRYNNKIKLVTCPPKQREIAQADRPQNAEISLF